MLAGTCVGFVVQKAQKALRVSRRATGMLVGGRRAERTRPAKRDRLQQIASRQRCFRSLGFRIECVMIGVPHTAHLGIGSHIIGNVMWPCLVDRVCGGTTQEDNVNGLMDSKKQRYSENKETNRIQGKLTVDRVRTQGGWPKLKAKAAATRHLTRTALVLAQKHLSWKAVAVAHLLVQFYELIGREEVFWSKRAEAEFTNDWPAALSVVQSACQRRTLQGSEVQESLSQDAVVLASL